MPLRSHLAYLRVQCSGLYSSLSTSTTCQRVLIQPCDFLPTTPCYTELSVPKKTSPYSRRICANLNYGSTSGRCSSMRTNARYYGLPTRGILPSATTEFMTSICRQLNKLNTSVLPSAQICLGTNMSTTL